MKKKNSNNRTNPQQSTSSVPEGGVRLNKYLSNAGISSRRKTAELVKNGQVKVNGEVETHPATIVLPGDTVEYQGKEIKRLHQLYYFLLNKPKNVISTTDDEKDRRTVIDLVDKDKKLGVFPVGRLDRNTTGLILLTNDGDLSYKLTHPSFKVGKVYEVTLDKNLSSQDLEKIRNGIQLEEGVAVPDAVNYIYNRPQNEISIEVHIGWNRVIRRIFESLNYEVKKLDRVYFAGLTKKALSRGRFRPLTNEEVTRLKVFNQL